MSTGGGKLKIFLLHHLGHSSLLVLKKIHSLSGAWDDQGWQCIQAGHLQHRLGPAWSSVAGYVYLEIVSFSVVAVTSGVDQLG